MSSTIGIIIFFSFTGLEVIGLIFWSILRDYLPRKYGPHYDQAIIEVWDGVGWEKAVKGRKVESPTAGSTAYKYKRYSDNKPCIVLCNGEYPVEYQQGKRKVAAEIGTMKARALPGHKPIDYLESDLLIEMDDHATVALYRSLKKKGIPMNMLLIIGVIVILVVAAVYFVPKLTKKKTTTIPGNQITTTQPIITTNPVIR